MENEQGSVPVKKWVLYIEKGKIVLEFNEYNGLHKGLPEINVFIKEIKKEVTRASKAMDYINDLKRQPDLFHNSL